MKKLPAILILTASVFLTSCADVSKKENQEALNDNQKIVVNNEAGAGMSIMQAINNALQSNFEVFEIDNPGLILPADIDPLQVKKYFQISDIYFALVLKPSMNVYLGKASTEFNQKIFFSGILIARKNESNWQKFLVIQDKEPDNKNNPYYLWSEKQKILLSVVDQNGAGSGEGIMKVFVLSGQSGWKLDGCYYFSGDYESTAGEYDYFAFSAKLSSHKTEPLENCSGDATLLVAD